MPHRTFRSRWFNIAATFASCAMLALTLSCRSPLQASWAKADCTLSFIVSGSSSAAMRAAAGVSGGEASRLILPSATELTVTLTPSSGNLTDSVSQTVPLEPGSDGAVKNRSPFPMS